MKQLITLVFICLSIGVSFSQDMPIVFDRPGIADSPYLVEKKTWQLECGIGYANITGWSDVPNPSVMIRKLVSSNNELRLTYNYGLQMVSLIKSDLKNGFDQLALGWKHQLCKENGRIPESSFILNTYFPIQKLSTLSHSGIYNIEAGFQFQNNFNERFALNYNIGGLLTNVFKRGVVTSSLCLNITGNDRLAFFTEAFVFAPIQYGKIEPGVDFGLVFNPTKRSQIDVSIVDNFYKRNQYLTVLVGYSVSLGSKRVR